MESFEACQSIDGEQQQQDQTSSNITSTSIRLPAILDGEYFSVIGVEDNKVTARCLQCHKPLNGNLKSTGNFLNHIKRVHPFLVDKIKRKTKRRKPAIPYIDLTGDEYPESDYQPGNEATNDDDQYNDDYSNDDHSSDSSSIRGDKSDEAESSALFKDEIDVFGRYVAAKLRNYFCLYIYIYIEKKEKESIDMKNPTHLLKNESAVLRCISYIHLL